MRKLDYVSALIDLIEWRDGYMEVLRSKSAIKWSEAELATLKEIE